jgi:hypothetical protein
MWLGGGRRVAVLAAVLGALALLAAGCGGSSAVPSVASLGTTTSSGATTPSSSAASGAGPGTSASSAGGVSHIGMTIAGGSSANLMKYASCMRSNGEPSFPDPNSQGQLQFSGDPNSAGFQRAQQACQKDLPNHGEVSPAQQQQMRTQALAMSACMRSHGVPDFPDPTFGTGGSARISIKGGSASGLDPNSPQFQAAMKDCMPKGPLLPSAVGATAGGGG